MTSHACLFHLISVISLLKLIKYIRTRQGVWAYIKGLLPDSYQDRFLQLPKTAFKKYVHDLLLLMMEAEDNYVETPILLYKIEKFT